MKNEKDKENGKTQEEAPVDSTDAWQAYERLKPKLAAMPANAVQRFRANVPKAVANAFKLIRSFDEGKALFAPLFSTGLFKAEELEDLNDRAMALWHSDIKLRQAMSPAGSLPELLKQAKALQKKLRKNALFLWSDNGSLNAVLSEIRRGRSRLDTADDLAALASLFESRWPEAENNCGLKKADIEAARTLSIQLVNALNSTVNTSEAAYWRDQRDRAGVYLFDGIRTVRIAAMMVFKSNPDALAAYPALCSVKKTKREPKESNPAPDSPVSEAAAQIPS